jgi:putative transposase
VTILYDASGNPIDERKWLRHVRPSWISDGGDYFLTICTHERRINTLCTSQTGATVLDAVKHYSDAHRWFVHISLLMPDHLHSIVCLPPDESINKIVTDFKRATARTTGVRWQSGFFEHRIRNDESLDEKAHYIAMNPERKGLIDVASKWQWVFRTGEDVNVGRNS